MGVDLHAPSKSLYPEQMKCLNVGLIRFFLKGDQEYNHRSYMKLIMIVLAALVIGGCSSTYKRGQLQSYPENKIKFRLDNIRPDGLRGQPDALVSVAYEFCVPADNNVYQELQKIDLSLTIHRGLSGRVGCTRSQSLCIGETNQPHWNEVLQELSSLEYIIEIRQSFFE